MGAPIATRLADAGYDVLGYDVALGGPTLPAASVDVLVTVLPGPIELEDALIRDAGLAALRPDGLWVDLTSNAPDVAERIAALAATSGLASVGAPMAGGPSAAGDGTLRFFVGGADAAIERARPVLASLGEVDVIGEHVGAGCTAKLLANLLWFGQVVAVTEALLLGVSLGVPVGVLRRTLASSAGGSVFIDEYLDRLLEGDYLETFSIARVVEELDTLVRLANEYTVPFELSTLVARQHRDALDRFGAVDGELLAAKLLEERARIRLSDASS
jgi:3-hydroxyisobutyrate dehydrogenase-like beta-hydroxyacid dehydrogenase